MGGHTTNHVIRHVTWNPPRYFTSSQREACRNRTCDGDHVTRQSQRSTIEPSGPRSVVNRPCLWVVNFEGQVSKKKIVIDRKSEPKDKRKTKLKKAKRPEGSRLFCITSVFWNDYVLTYKIHCSSCYISSNSYVIMVFFDKFKSWRRLENLVKDKVDSTFILKKYLLQLYYI